MDGFRILVLLLVGGCVWTLRQSSICGIPLSRGKIVGGVDSGGYRYPWFALLLLKRNSYLPVPVCAGSLISRYHVLTAAHCFSISSSVQNRNLFSVALGVYDVCSDAEDSREIFDVEDVAVHEKYKRSGKFFDIALMKLARPAGYVFICLPIIGVPDVTEVAVVIGFGATKENDGFVPCHMMEANVTKYSKADCAKSKLPKQDVQEPTVICAGSLEGDVDSCYGDSGGPLQTIASDGRYVIAGIVSYGYGCAAREVPGVYTNVGSYLPWIAAKMSSKGQSVPERKAVLERADSGVAFPGRDASSASPADENSPIDVQHYGAKRPAVGERQRKPKKNSSVTFPK